MPLLPPSHVCVPPWWLGWGWFTAPTQLKRPSCQYQLFEGIDCRGFKEPDLLGLAPILFVGKTDEDRKQLRGRERKTDEMCNVLFQYWKRVGGAGVSLIFLIPDF